MNKPSTRNLESDQLILEKLKIAEQIAKREGEDFGEINSLMSWVENEYAQELTRRLQVKKESIKTRLENETPEIRRQLEDFERSIKTDESVSQEVEDKVDAIEWKYDINVPEWMRNSVTRGIPRTDWIRVFLIFLFGRKRSLQSAKKELRSESHKKAVEMAVKKISLVDRLINASKELYKFYTGSDFAYGELRQEKDRVWSEFMWRVKNSEEESLKRLPSNNEFVKSLIDEADLPVYKVDKLLEVMSK
ncbi:MAG: hypothetical protein ABEJ24_01340 [Candidatus Magasanikbacteria bacterium]